MAKELEPKEFYNNGITDRQPFIDRAIRNAELTLPYLIRDNGTGTDAMKDKYGQSFGGRAVNSLKAKIGMALFPPASSSFRLDPTAEQLEAAGIDIQVASEEEVAEDDARAAIYSTISRATGSINKEIDSQSIRDTMFEVIAQELVVGSVIVEKVKGDGVRYHPLDSFVVKLDNRGRALCMCIVETLYELPVGFESLEDDKTEEYELYTMIKKVNGEEKWEVTQQIDDFILPKTITYTTDKLPFKYTGWNYMVGDAYHRPYVDDYYEDLRQFSSLSHSITDGSIAAAKTLILVDERNGRTFAKDIDESDNLDVVIGKEDDIGVFQLGKNYDFQFSMDTKAELKRDIAAAFLMNESATREAERVTAAEIQFLAQELETTSLAGTYSKLSESLVKWNIHQVMNEMGLTFKELGVKIVVGLDALGRSNEARGLDAFVQTIVGVGAGNRLNSDELTNRYASFYGIDTTGLLKTNTQIAKEQQAQQAQQQEAMLGEEGAKSAGQEAGKAVVANAQQQ